MLLCKSVQKQGGRGEKGTLLFSHCPAKNMADGTVQRRDEVAESSSPVETHWPLTLLLNEKFWEWGWKIQ